MFKPFRTPLLKNHPQRPSQSKGYDTVLESPPRRKTAHNHTPPCVSAHEVLEKTSKTIKKPEICLDNSEGYYLVLWCLNYFITFNNNYIY